MKHAGPVFLGHPVYLVPSFHYRPAGISCHSDCLHYHHRQKHRKCHCYRNSMVVVSKTEQRLNTVALKANKCGLKSLWNQCVFTILRKRLLSVTDRTSVGNKFHIPGPTFLKTHSADLVHSHSMVIMVMRSSLLWSFYKSLYALIWLFLQ